MWQNRTMCSGPVPTQNCAFCNAYSSIVLCPYFCLRLMMTYCKTYILILSNSCVVHLLRKSCLNDKILVFHTISEENMFLSNFQLSKLMHARSVSGPGFRQLKADYDHRIIKPAHPSKYLWVIDHNFHENICPCSVGIHCVLIL